MMIAMRVLMVVLMLGALILVVLMLGVAVIREMSLAPEVMAVRKVV